MLRAECHSARMSKITNDGLTRSVTGCFIAVSILALATVGVKGSKLKTTSTLHVKQLTYRNDVFEGFVYEFNYERVLQ